MKKPKDKPMPMPKKLPKRGSRTAKFYANKK